MCTYDTCRGNKRKGLEDFWEVKRSLTGSLGSPPRSLRNPEKRQSSSEPSPAVLPEMVHHAQAICFAMALKILCRSTRQPHCLGGFSGSRKCIGPSFLGAGLLRMTTGRHPG